MSAETNPHLRLEIAHVLFTDIVGYSKLLIDEQRELLQELNDIVRKTDQVLEAEAEGKLVRLPTGDGMALVFSNNLEAPVECALEISKALQGHPEIKLRMGIHSGAVNQIADVNDRSNVAGGGINIAQRVMDCGDAGHILLSRHIAEDLAQYRRWQPLLHDLGDCEVKHGARVFLVNLYTEELGNPAMPEKFRKFTEQMRSVTETPPVADAKPKRIPWSAIAATLLLIAALLAGVLIFSHRSGPQQTNAPATSAPAISAVPARSIAVLPFDNLSSDKENAYFTDGVQDEILTNLAKIADMTVISRTSVMQYKSGAQRNLREIGQQLGVAHVLEGSVQRASGKVRVNTQLIDARTDAHLWAQVYDRPLDDVFAIQSEIAKAIADQLQAKLSASEKTAIERPPTSDITAFDLYSRAKTLLLGMSFSAEAKQNLLQATDLLNQAVARDPQYFLAYCQLVTTHAYLYLFGLDHTPERRALAETAVQAAFRLQPDAGEAHLARAACFYRVDLDYGRALTELAIARRTLPSDSRVFEMAGYIQRRQGQYEESLHNLERALELDPRNFTILQQTAQSYQSLRHYADEARTLDRAFAINPTDDTKVVRAIVDFDWKADTRPLRETIESIRTERPDAVGSVADYWLNCALAERDARAAENALVALGENIYANDAVVLSHDVCEGLVAQMTNDQAKSRASFLTARAQQEKLVQVQPDYGPAVCVLGLIDAGLGRKEEALREGRRAVELLPIAKDSINGAHMIEYLAMIAAWVGDKELACEQLAIATSVPGTLSYGQLKLYPYWDPLRGDPRFEKIVASLAPREASSK